MSEVVLQLVDLRKSFDGVEVLKGVNGTVDRGDVIGLIGLNGAGKTTLLETALGFCPVVVGASRVLGKDSSRQLDAETKVRIGFVPQHDELLGNQTGRRYLALIGAFYRNWNPALIDRLGIEWAVPLDKRIDTLSVGQRQKLSLLAAMGHEPELIILDEPVASLDPLARRQFLRELVQIASGHDRTIIFSTHIMSDLERVASRVWLMKDGVIAVDEALDVLKERTARVHLPPGVPVPQSFLQDALIHHRSEQNAHILTFNNWTPEQHRRLEQDAGCSLTPEWLSLEEIFVEIHS
jgi:ABC-2 type transport system ATP-binding protein